MNIKVVIFYLLVSNSLLCMEFDKQENDNSDISDPDIIWRAARDAFYDEEKWTCRFSFLNFGELPVIIRSQAQLHSHDQYIHGKDYITPAVIVGFTNDNKHVTICRAQDKEHLVIRYEKSLKKSIGLENSSLIQLNYVPVEAINSLLIWCDEEEKEIVDLPLNEDLVLKRLFCCCIDQQMAVVHQLEGEEEALVITFNEE